MPPVDHRSAPELFLNIFCKGTLNPVLDTIARSLKASCQVLAVNSAHGRTRKGYPVSLMLLNIVVRTMMAKPIQNKTKNPLKSL